MTCLLGAHDIVGVMILVYRHTPKDYFVGAIGGAVPEAVGGVAKLGVRKLIKKGVAKGIIAGLAGEGAGYGVDCALEELLENQVSARCSSMPCVLA